ncbi:MAG: relaxase domain-containing protein, partial [Alphaproteobacteria bacterium]|nr:relaxase domain-containing protein [Alphaproteobacteria bacterium]
MLTIDEAVPDAGYYRDAKNYYSADAAAPSAWYGRGAEALGLSGAVNDAQYAALYEGRLPNGVVLGRTVDDQHQHGTPRDLTFSAPKSVSIMALAGGDRRLITAFQEAAREALTWMEENAVHSRITKDGRTVSRKTGNLVAATYLHELTREQDPGLHLHAVTMNATQGPDGKWRSLDNPHLYWNAKEADLRCHAALALKVRKLGYNIVPDPERGSFEIAGFSRPVIDGFSTRQKQIAANLAAKGLDLETANLQERHVAGRETRSPKPKNVDKEALNASWQQELSEQGMDLKGKRAAALARTDNPAYHQQTTIRMRADARDAVRTAARILAEKKIVFSDVDLLKESEKQAVCRADRDALRIAVRQLEREEFLQAKEVSRYEHRVAGEHVCMQGWTTAEAVATEEGIVRCEQQGRGAVPPMLSATMARRVAAAAGKNALQWEDAHQQALFGLVTSRDRVVALDAPLGSSSAAHLAERYLAVGKALDVRVRLMSPSTAGARALSDLVGRPALTIAQHLADLKKEPMRWRQERVTKQTQPHVWVVGDAGRLRPELLKDLLEAAGRFNARVVLMEQGYQAQRFGSPGYRLLRDRGITTFRLPAEERPERNELYQALAALNRSDPVAALQHVEKAGGRVIAFAPAGRTPRHRNVALWERQSFIADRYCSLPAEERARTRVLEVTRHGREATSAAIRDHLVATGGVTGPMITADVLIAKPMSKTERQQAVSYEPGDI